MNRNLGQRHYRFPENRIVSNFHTIQRLSSHRNKYNFFFKGIIYELFPRMDKCYPILILFLIQAVKAGCLTPPLRIPSDFNQRTDIMGLGCC